MERQPVFYTLKVWLWSAAISPFVAAAMQFYYYHANTREIDWLLTYPAIVFFELLLTCLLWVLFWAITTICSNLLRSDTALRLAASATGLSIGGAIYYLIGQGSDFSLENMFLAIALANALCIFAGCWYFNVGKPLPEPYPPYINTDSYEQTTQQFL